MEPERLGELIDRLSAGLALFARQWCDSPEDVVQDAFVALATLPAEPEVPAGWLYRAVRNGAINAGIAQRRRKRRETWVSRQRSPWFEPFARTGTPANAAIEPDAAEAALAGLPDPQREVIVAHLWGGLTFDQIADLLQTSSSSAHRHYQAGLQTLRAQLGIPCRTKTPRSNPT